MIYEYAVEPRLIAQWAILGIGRMVGQFGMDQRRLVSDFPADWSGEVWGEFYQHFDCDDTCLEFENAKPTLDAYLQILTESVISRRAPIEPDLDWVSAALKEHTARPFHAILAECNAASNSAVITIDILESVRDSRWYLPTVKPSLKTAVEIAKAIRPLVARAREIVIVDPYFRAKEKSQSAPANRWVDPLVAILPRWPLKVLHLWPVKLLHPGPRKLMC